MSSSSPPQSYCGPLVEPLNDPTESELRDSPYHLPEFGAGQMNHIFETQLFVETSGFMLVQAVTSGRKSGDKEKSTEIMEKLRNHWYRQLLAAFQKKLERLRVCFENYNGREPQKKWTMSVLPFLSCLPANQIADIMLIEAMRLARLVRPDSGCDPYYLRIELGNAVEKKYRIAVKNQERLTDELKAVYPKYLKHFTNDRDCSNLNHRQFFEEISPGWDVLIDIPRWPLAVKRKVGEALLEIITNECRVVGEGGLLSPAFFYSYDFNAGIQWKPTRRLVNLVRKITSPEKLHFNCDSTPMLCPPVPWIGIQMGGRLTGSEYFVKSIDYDGGHLPLKELQNATRQELLPIFDALNQMAATPWIINKQVLDVALELFANTDIRTAKQKKYPFAETLDLLSLQRSEKQIIAQHKELRKREARIALLKLLDEPYSSGSPATAKWSMEHMLLYKLSLANHLKDKVFWFPYEVDFRGRVYPASPYFNHTGDDLSKSLLMFGKGKPLGPSGLDWLKIFCISLTGLKKNCSTADKLQFANVVLDEILDSARDPLNGRKWWSQADEPWQVLSVCFEISNALASKDPTNFISHVPIHQDGTCNGLQHYAGLSRDEVGATHVNLADSDFPGDLYSAVAERVEEQRRIDAEKGRDIAKQLKGLINRKLVKRTVMTVPYGVTEYGAKEQLSHFLQSDSEIPSTVDHVKASKYLSKIVLKSLRSSFPQSMEIQEWLRDLANYVGRILHEPLVWKSPLGLPIVQPYIRLVKPVPPACSQLDFSLPPHKVEYLDCVNSSKQRNAFPPNFIHSLDACHMMLTALHCHRAGIPFAAIHDCFLTSACDVEMMNKICRETFVQLHSLPLLQSLADELRKYLEKNPPRNIVKRSNKKLKLEKEYFEHQLNHLPESGDFDIKNVLKSQYFFS